MNEWQPIETAPKDETDIIVCGGIYGCEYGLEFHNVEIKKPVPAYYDTFNKQWQFLHDVHSDSPCYLLPKLWMPLPEPPK